VAHRSSEPADPTSGILEALAETGAIGSTVRQLASRVASPLSDVSQSLSVLSARGRVVRMGRGLWILRDFERLHERADFVEPASYTERFEREFGVALGQYHGTITFSGNDEIPVHRWWPYVQGYSAEFVRDLLARMDLPRSENVLDPFAGSGTTLVEARLAGYRAIGTELLPVAALAARVKTSFEVDRRPLEAAARRLLDSARRRAPGPLPFLRETRRHFAPRVVRDLTRLRDALPPEGAAQRDALRLAFGRILIPVSRLRRSPCLGYGPKPAADSADVFERYWEGVEQMAEDLAWLDARRADWGPPAWVLPTDARSLPLPPESVGVAVTSPPYVNGMDYVMNYKLDLAWLGYVDSYAGLAHLRDALVACDNLPRKTVEPYQGLEKVPDPWLTPILKEIRSNVARKGSYRRDDMDGMVLRYFLDLWPVMKGVYRSLVPGGRFALVVGDSLLAGTYIPCDLLLARLGARAGFRVRSVEVARPRRSGQRRSFELRESIVMLEKPGGRRRARRVHA